MGKRRIYDEDVNEVFGLFGVEVAIYFEALRYRQQLHQEEFFPMTREDIRKRTDLTYKQQRRVREILTVTGWIETCKNRSKHGGTVTAFKLTDMAIDLIRNTVRQRRQELTMMKRDLAVKFA